ncbi:MAG: phosphatidate cytidylyltransferase [Pseudomonadota bacterium]
MSTPAGRWDDLRERLISGILLLAVGFGAIWAGGWWFFALVVVLAAAMIWELTRLIDASLIPRDCLVLVLLGIAALFVANLLPFIAQAPFLLLAAVCTVLITKSDQRLFGLFYGAVLLTAMGLFNQRDHFGLVWMIWLVAVVVQSDVLGYFAGRFLGGPKFWPSLSPSKTWSGTVAGWIGAAVIGAVFAALTPASPVVIVYSVLMAFAAQMGDITESWLKRRRGVKDSSNLIPGHGGVLDRFDGLVGATLALLVIEQITNFPPRLPGAL